jgi:hypothetical protein
MSVSLLRVPLYSIAITLPLHAAEPWSGSFGSSQNAERLGPGHRQEPLVRITPDCSFQHNVLRPISRIVGAYVLDL